MSMYKNLTTFAAVAVLGLGLAACGGGGGSSPTTSTGTGGTGGGGAMPATVTLPSGIPAGMAPSGTHEIAAGDSATSNGVTFSCPAGGEACTVTVAADGSVTSTGGTATAALSPAAVAANEKSRDEAKAAANKVALSKKAAITAELNLQNDGTTTPPADRPFDGTDAAEDAVPSATNNYRLTVKHTGSAVEVTVVDGALAAKSDPKFERAATFGNGQMLVRNMGNEREIIVLHTDIEADTDTPFSRAPGINLDQDTDTDYTGNESIRIQTTDAAVANYHDGMASSRFMHSGDADAHTITFRVADSTATPPVAASKFSGTYDGAPGTYECTGSTACTVTVNRKNEVTGVAGDWNFTPNAGATVPVADDDYLTYGFWLATTTKDGAITSYDTVQTFATSSLDASTGVLAVEGTATYEGGAAGVYVHETFKEDSTVDTRTSGRFTADVALKAYFDAETLPFATDTLGGTISNFDLDGGPENSWNVNISAGFGNDGALTNGVASGMKGDNGSLSGQFHGPATAASAPPVLVGEFNSNFINGSVAGAFGARKQ